MAWLYTALKSLARVVRDMVVRRVRIAVVVLVGAFFSCGLEGMPLQVVFVRGESGTPVILTANPGQELETLQFTVVEPPTQGILLGTPPNLFYVPKPDFLGTDWFSYLVRSAGGELLDFGTVQLRVLRSEAMVFPQYRSEGQLTVSGPLLSLNNYTVTVSLHGGFRYFDMELWASWGQSGFTNLRGIWRAELEGTWPVEWRLPIASTLTFNPSTVSLVSWTVDARATASGWEFSYYLYYAGDQPETNSYAVLGISTTISGISVASRTKFATLTPTFAEQVLELRGPALCSGCKHRWEVEYVQKKTGFEHLIVKLRDLPIPCPACASLQTFLDVKVRFTAPEKKVEPTLRLVAGFVGCVRPLVSLLTPGGGLGFVGFEIFGVEVRCDLPGGFNGRCATSFNPNRDAEVTGYPQFFEVVQLEGPVRPCCGSAGWWQISLYFSRSAGYVFGLAMGDVNLYFSISREVLVNLRLKSGLVDPNDPAKTWELTFGWKAIF